MDVAQIVAAAAVSVAAIVDVRTRRIPNWITGGLLLVGIALHAWLGGGSGALAALAGALLGGALLVPFYAIRAIGAGDVKLLAALGAVLGPQVLVSVAIYGAIVGGVMSVWILATRGRLGRALADLFVRRQAPRRSGATAPYGVAIASGVYLSLVLPGLLA